MTTDIATNKDLVKAKLEGVSLPKWPQMLVWGTPVNAAQAAEIILRTDPFLTTVNKYSGGNNQKWNQWAREELGLSLVNKFLAEHLEMTIGEQIGFESAVQQHINEAVGVVLTEYVGNDWASCAFIYGPHGWLHPDGTIGYIDNVGKWPEAEAVYNDWVLLAKAFPYLELHATLMSEEASEHDTSYPLVTFIVANGQVHVAQEAFAPADAFMPVRKIKSINASDFFCGREQGLPDSAIKEYGKILKPIVQKAVEIASESYRATNEMTAQGKLPAP